MLKDADVLREFSELNLGSKIRQLRKKKALTLQNISDFTGLSKPLLSQIENSITVPPLATLIKISKALGVSINFFFKENQITDRISVVREKERKRIVHGFNNPIDDAGYHYDALAKPISHHKLDPFYITVDPLMPEEVEFYSHLGHEFLYLLEGRLEYSFQGEHNTITLESGDSIYFDSEIPHSVRALDEKEAKAIAVIYAPK